VRLVVIWYSSDNVLLDEDIITYFKKNVKSFSIFIHCDEYGTGLSAKNTMRKTF